ncbi:response regulator [Phreatobacter sp. AB_2022a]|uniref:response regulator n=1 Tax=Phreatobacter sp. AB_2022a TaxID=3003134 RepID=UPI0022876E80|nr:response regulator [Phreatobacter sp. AB_2022a]MCZ0733868.1 response regulator [Phreatobacter sp. AB_2022a]
MWGSREGRPLGNPRILIVEDDPFIAIELEAVVTDALSGAVEVMIAGSLASAAVAAAEPLDFVLLDIDVVGGKTFALATMLAARGTPFAFASASLPADLPETLQFARFVGKPFSGAVIEALVLEMLRPALLRAATGVRDDGAGAGA